MKIVEEGEMRSLTRKLLLPNLNQFTFWGLTDIQTHIRNGPLHELKM